MQHISNGLESGLFNPLALPQDIPNPHSIREYRPICAMPTIARVAGGGVSGP